MRENGEQFVKTVVQYLQRKLPNIHGPGPLKEEHLNKVNFHAESLATILVRLRPFCTTISCRASPGESQQHFNVFFSSRA